MKKDGFCLESWGKRKSKQDTGRDKSTQTIPKNTFDNNTLIGQIVPVENGYINVSLILYNISILIRPIKPVIYIFLYFYFYV